MIESDLSPFASGTLYLVRNLDAESMNIVYSVGSAINLVAFSTQTRMFVYTYIT